MSAKPAAAQTSILQDEFNATTFDSSIWDVHDSSWYLQRTRYGSTPQIKTEGTTSFARFNLDTYNSAYAGTAAKGTEIWSKNAVSLGDGVQFETRMRATSVPRGLVMAFYTYKDRPFSDPSQQEIDCEQLGNQASNQLWLNVWKNTTTNAESNPTVSGLNRAVWVTYKVRWYSDRVEWYVDDVLIRTETTVVPSDPMKVCFSLWAASSAWSTAYDSGLALASRQSANQNYYFDVDYIRVTSLAQTSTPYTGTPLAIPGTIQAEDYDKGGEGVAYHDDDTLNQGGSYRLNEGVDVSVSGDTDGSYNIGWTNPGEWTKYSVSVAQAGTYKLQSRVSSVGGGGKFHLEFNGVDQTGPITIPDTGHWQSYVTLENTVDLQAGPQVMKLVMDSYGPSGALGNFNWFKVVSSAADTTAPTITVTTPGAAGYYKNPAIASGTAADTGGSGLNSVHILLKRDSDGLIWDGTNWGPTPAMVQANGTASWTFQLPAMADGKYSIAATARDGAGNTATSTAFVFFMDSTPPTVTITAPPQTG